MTKLETIEQEIEKLSTEELKDLRNWFTEFSADAWDKQIEQDAEAGKFDVLAKKAIAEYKSGKSQKLILYLE